MFEGFNNLFRRMDHSANAPEKFYFYFTVNRQPDIFHHLTGAHFYRKKTFYPAIDKPLDFLFGEGPQGNGA